MRALEMPWFNMMVLDSYFKYSRKKTFFFFDIAISFGMFLNI